METNGKKILVFVIVLCFVIAEVFGGGGPQQSASMGKVTIKVLGGAQMEESPPGIVLFQEQNPNVAIEYEPIQADNFAPRFAALTAANQVPDVIAAQSGHFVNLTKSGVYMELTEELKGLNYEGDQVWQDTFIPEILVNSRNILRVLGPEYTSKFYGIPNGMTSIAIVYDKKLFRELGAQPPANWKEFESLNDLMASKGITPISLCMPWLDWYPRLFWDQYCRSILDPDPSAFETGKLKFTDEPVKAGLRAFKDMWDRKWLPESGLTITREVLLQTFVQGKIGQFLTTPGNLVYLTENLPNVELSSYSFPGILGLTPRSLGGSSSVYGVSVKTKYKEQAIRFIKYYSSRTNWALPPYRFSMSGLKDVKKDPLADAISVGFNQSAAGGFTPEIYVPVNASPELNNAWRSDLFANYLLGVYTLDHVVTELQRIYEESYLANIKK
jgi:ABC-type glycerol-3-phosphate transport system substrate-binding protein